MGRGSGNGERGTGEGGRRKRRNFGGKRHTTQLLLVSAVLLLCECVGAGSCDTKEYPIFELFRK